jgi:hypothetical protein
VLTGFLISRLPARQKEVYFWADPVERRPVRKIPVREVKPAHAGRHDSQLIDKLWSAIGAGIAPIGTGQERQKSEQVKPVKRASYAVGLVNLLKGTPSWNGVATNALDKRFCRRINEGKRLESNSPRLGKFREKDEA